MPENLSESRLNAEKAISCRWCGLMMENRPRRKYCSDSCRLKAWQYRTYKRFTSDDGEIIEIRRVKCSGAME